MKFQITTPPPRLFYILTRQSDLWTEATPSHWHKRLVLDLAKLGFEELMNAACAFQGSPANCGREIFVLVYTGDSFILTKRELGLNWFNDASESLYDVRHCKFVEWFLGVCLVWSMSKDEIFELLRMSQPVYVLSILRRFRMCKSKPLLTPMIEPSWNEMGRVQGSITVGEHYIRKWLDPCFFWLLWHVWTFYPPC